MCVCVCACVFVPVCVTPDHNNRCHKTGIVSIFVAWAGILCIVLGVSIGHRWTVLEPWALPKFPAIR